MERALVEFCKENAELKLARSGRRWISADGRLSLLQGDILALPGDGRYTHIWDRASLIAMDPSKRSAYVSVLSNALAPGGKILLSTLARVVGPPEALRAGPPFSVDEAEVRRLYGPCFRIRRLSVEDALSSNPRFRAQGLSKVSQLTFLLVKK